MSIDPSLFKENERTAPTSSDRLFLEVGDLTCKHGGYLPSVTVAYETWGTFNESKSNAVLIQHALSGDSHAIGWWERMIGPGKPIDTEKFFVIGHNTLGGCQGTTGPASLAEDGLPYGSRFPKITVEDMVTIQERLVASFGIKTLKCVAGGSMGGMMCLEWARRSTGDSPIQTEKAFITASALRHSAMQIGFNETARQAIKRDPKWKGGDYLPTEQPADGLSVARMVGHLSYLSQGAFEAKFGRRKQTGNEDLFQVESYLNYQGDKFTNRFDANSLIVLMNAIDAYSCESLRKSTTTFLVVSFSSDWLYTPGQSREILEMANRDNCQAVWHNLELEGGHDTFLLDGTLQGELVREFLDR